MSKHGVRWTKEQLAAYYARQVVAQPSDQASSSHSLETKIRTGKKMNKTEAEFDLILRNRPEVVGLKDQIESITFEGITLRIGDGVRYTPDFAVILKNKQIALFETKGPYLRPDSIVKIKVARDVWPCFSLEVWQRQQDRSWRKIL